MSNKFSFSEDAQTEIIGVYNGALTETQQQTSQLVEKMNILCEKTKFKPMLDIANEAIKFYCETLQEIIRNHFNEWVDSESSLQAFARTMEAGDDAVGTAQRLEAGLSNEIDIMFSVLPELLNIDTSQAEMAEEDYDELKEIVTKYFNAIEEISNQYINTIETNGEDNSAFLTIKGVVSSTLGDIQHSFEAMAEGMNSVREDFSAKLQSNKSNAETVNEQMKSVAEQSGDAFKGFASMFKI